MNRIMADYEPAVVRVDRAGRLIDALELIAVVRELTVEIKLLRDDLRAAKLPVVGE